ncbi:MAG: terminase family protein [Acidobacteria bacterium]|nr:terminase family protein [Acidobacteriota bacterium]
MSRDDVLSLLTEDHRRTTEKLRTYFPDAGPLRRELYPKHVEFFALGKDYKERLFMAANRIGKSGAGAFEVACHATGLYPAWWAGRRFDHPVDVWACGTTNETTRDIVQRWLCGPTSELERWTGGMIPAHLIVDFERRRGVPNSLESVTVTHTSGGTSTVGMKTYEQGRKSFEGTAKHVIWDDEEPPQDIYTEQLYRTVTTKGITLITFTPLQGMSEVVTGFLEPTDAAKPYKVHVQAGWDHVPHLDAAEKAALLATTLPHQVKARTTGEPSLGSGAIYPVNEADLIVPTRTIPDSWLKGYALDVGWNRTACLWGAMDPTSGVIELYDEHYKSQGEPLSHVQAILARGAWIPGVIDPAAFGSSQLDGRVAMQVYTDLGLDLQPAINAVEAGLTDVWQRMIGGRLRVQAHLSNFLSEFRRYHRDEKGNIVKANDHLMDDCRYLCMSGRFALKPKARRQSEGSSSPQSWMGG